MMVEVGSSCGYSDKYSGALFRMSPAPRPPVLPVLPMLGAARQEQYERELSRLPANPPQLQIRLSKNSFYGSQM